MNDTTPLTSKSGRLVRRVATTLIAVALGWIVVSNLFLNTPLASWTINRRPDRWKVTWDRAWMIVPGKVVASGIVYEQHIGRVDILVKARNASCTIPIPPLLDRRFVLEGIHADSATVVLGRRPPQPATPPAPPKPASTKPRKPGWFIEILNARVDSIEEFSADNFAMTGGASAVSGSFIKQLGGNMELREIALNWKDAKVRIKDSDDSTKGVSIAFRGGMTPFSPRVDRGWASLKHLTGSLDVEGRIVSLAPLQALFAGSGWLNGLDGAGDVSAHLVMDKGQLSPESRLRATADNLVVAFMDFEASGAGHVGFARDASDRGDNTHIELALDEFRFGRGGQSRPLARGKNLQLTIDALNFRLGTPAEKIKIVIDLPESEMPDVAVLGEWLPESLGLKLDKGRARLSAHLESTGLGKPAKGTFHVGGQGLTGKFRDLDFRIDMDADMRLSGSHWNELKVGVDGTRIRFFNGEIHGEGVPVDPGWWMTLGLTNGVASFGKPLAIEGDVDLTMRDIRAVIAVGAIRRLPTDRAVRARFRYHADDAPPREVSAAASWRVRASSSSDCSLIESTSSSGVVPSAGLTASTFGSGVPASGFRLCTAAT